MVLSFLPNLLHSGAPLGDDVQYLMPFTLLGSSFPNVIPAGTGLSREILDFVERIRSELPGASERSRLAIKTYLKMILLALVNHYSELGATRESIYQHESDSRRLSAAAGAHREALRRADPGKRRGPALRHERLLLHASRLRT